MSAPAHAEPPRARAVPPAPPAVQPQPTPVARGLFTDQQSTPAPVQAPSPPRNSLFGIVTGAIRGRAAPAPQPEAARSEPALPQQAEPAPSVRPAATEEMGLDIPAFLRRQSS